MRMGLSPETPLLEAYGALRTLRKIAGNGQLSDRDGAEAVARRWMAEPGSRTLLVSAMELAMAIPSPPLVEGIEEMVGSADAVRAVGITGADDIAWVQRRARQLLGR